MPTNKDRAVVFGIYREMDADKRALVADHVNASLMKDINKKVKSSVLQVGKIMPWIMRVMDLNIISTQGPVFRD